MEMEKTKMPALRALPWLILVLSVMTCRCGDGRRRGEEHEGSPAADSAESSSGDSARVASGGPTQIEMRTVDLNVHDGVILQVQYLTGAMLPARSGQTVRLDDPTSFTIAVRTGEAAVDYEDLSVLMNEVVFDFAGAPVKNLKIEREEDADQQDRIELKLKLAKALGIPVEIEGKPEVTPNGDLRIRTVEIQALDIQVGGLLDLLDLEAEDILSSMEDRGVLIEGNDVILILDRILPPPRVKGRVRSVTIQSDRLELMLGTGGEPPAADTVHPNYLWFRKNEIQLGRVTMSDADLRIVDDEPSDPFDFNPNQLNRQLVAGYAKLSEDGGLTLFAPDFGDVGRASARDPLPSRKGPPLRGLAENEADQVSK